MVRLCEMLYDKKVVNEKACKQMLEHMYACDDKLKVPRLLPPGTRIAHKTGSVNASRTDAGIIDTPNGPIHEMTKHNGTTVSAARRTVGRSAVTAVTVRAAK